MKTMFFFLTILFVLSISLPSSAQTGSESALVASFGGSDFHIKDEHASPLIFNSTCIAPSLQFIRKETESEQYAEASFSSGKLSGSNSNFNTDNWRARARYSYMREIAILSDGARMFLGGSLGSFFCKSEYYYSLSGNFSGRAITSWYWSHSLDVSFLADYSPAAHESFSLLVFVPVVSNVSRPEFSSSGDYNYSENDWKIKMFGKTETLLKNSSVNSVLTYRRPLAGNFTVQLSYEFGYSFYGTPQAVGMYMNEFRAGVGYCF